ncbi:hypothetical protein PBAL39_13432 [Pedobacter sp. BAL39]|uniref:T9SS C-terminal target domain-containing protein n=1 Tax=Pedobacter sp. BAL39 TaxID=391596 RepID=UPI0001559A4C|nr:T9SS C-terminal target domain-containing protein [Pedobacter sp. BAL39]EDM35237.1 hypothetical protein PBAL39_13432 [Pedobacter sp. BAL39]
MRTLITFLFIFSYFNSFSAVPPNDNHADAQVILDAQDYCSSDGEFSNVDATSSNIRKGTFWNTEGKDVWFKFTALKTDLSIVVTGKSDGTPRSTLLNPVAAIYTIENNLITEMIGSMQNNGNATTVYKGGLSIGKVYYIRVSAENDGTGLFKLCVNNYTPPHLPGQDCSSAIMLCNKESFTENKLSGAGANNMEAVGSCLSVESNSSWYRWTAANNGTLTFQITPTNKSDDIDWVLYDLGPAGACEQIVPANILRCAAGSGVNCPQPYYMTGLNMSSTDLTESSGCVAGQDGFLRYLDMIQGHNYALLIDNFSNGNNGFHISFGGSGEFSGPTAAFTMDRQDACMEQQHYTFTNTSTDYASLKWSFGEGATVSGNTTDQTQTVSYSSPGYKTVVLEASAIRGCSATTSQSFYVALKPATPEISINQAEFCSTDSIRLAVPVIRDAQYRWTGPDNFQATTAAISISAESPSVSGVYHIAIQVGDCWSETTSITVPPINRNPVAAFSTDIAIPGKYPGPLPVQFINNSVDASNYLWDFGDGSRSTANSPKHTFETPGTYEIKLIASTSRSCVDAVTLSNLIILEKGSALVPNSFSPNNDGRNDEFNINLGGLRQYRISIYNRYGKLMFESNDINNSWKGTYQDQPVPVGAYYYMIIAKDQYGKDVKLSGSITLIR